MTTPAGRPAGPGLDLAQLRQLRERHRDHQHLVTRIGEHLEQHDGYLAFSGGKDSTVIAHLARQADPAVPVVWFDSGLEFPETRTFINDLATAWNLNLHVIHARPTALEILVASGAWDHDAPITATVSLDQALIEAPAQLAHTTFGTGEIWGVRATESSGRRHRYAASLRLELAAHCHGCCPTSSSPTREQRARHGGIIRRADTTVAYGPIWDWKTTQIWEYLQGRAVPVNPLYQRLQELGAPEHSQRVSHVIDGDHLQRGRVTWLRRGWPQLYAELLEHLPRLAEYT